MNRTFDETDILGYGAPERRVSWGAILAGAVTALALALLLWSLALAITLSATNATFGSLKDSAVALWICAIGATLVGAFVGGMVASYLAASPTRLLSVSHAFCAWCVAFLIASAVDWALLRSAMGSAGSALFTAANGVVQTTGSAMGGGAVRLEQNAEQVLTALGYSPAQARDMINNAQRDLRSTIQGQQRPSPPQSGGVIGGGPISQAAQQARGALDSAIDWSAGLGWSFFATWVASALLAILGASIVSGRMQRFRGATGARPTGPVPTP